MRISDWSSDVCSADLIAITDRPQPGLILTQRPHGMRDHPGQVAFPGGKLNAGADAVAAALREAHEELELDPQHVRVIGATDRYQDRKRVVSGQSVLVRVDYGGGRIINKIKIAI